ncbi:MAG: transporter substrate-binding domain-containing protein [Cohaesibacteraceae bacterium]|nr:transporter substrate-binding domain-containing protein [Cohaesibacteraceae bacterium]
MKQNVMKRSTFLKSALAGLALTLAATLMPGMSAFASATEVRILTEDFEPFDYMEDGELKGIAVAIVREMNKRVGYTGEIEVLPWKRAYKMTEKIPNVGLFSMARVGSREGKFQWVGPLFAMNETVFIDANSDVKIENLDDLRNVDSVLMQAGGGAQKMSKKAGLENIMEVHDAGKLAFMLLKGRTVAVVMPDVAMAHELKKQGKDSTAVRSVGTYGRLGLYLSFSNATAKDVVKKWEDAYASMVTDGTLAKIRAEYLPEEGKWNTAMLPGFEPFGRH